MFEFPVYQWNRPKLAGIERVSALAQQQHYHWGLSTVGSPDYPGVLRKFEPKTWLQGYSQAKWHLEILQTITDRVLGAEVQNQSGLTLSAVK